MDCRGAIHGRNLFRQVEAKINYVFLCFLIARFFAKITLFLPADYTCLFRRVGRYDGALRFKSVF